MQHVGQIQCGSLDQCTLASLHVWLRLASFPGPIPSFSMLHAEYVEKIGSLGTSYAKAILRYKPNLPIAIESHYNIILILTF